MATTTPKRNRGRPRKTEVQKRTTKNAKRIYQKKIELYITGTDKTKINSVARAIHSLNTDTLVGGAAEREVQMTHESSDIKQIYYGRV